MADDTKQLAAVYVGWTTFKNALDQLSQGLPHFIDKKVFDKQSWGVQAQLMSGLKFLGLIDDNGVPTPSLVALAVPQEEERKKQLAKIIRERYADLFALDLSKVTQTQLAQQMNASYGVTGDTREKGMRFFLGALAYLGIPVSRYIKLPKAANGNAPRKRRAARKAKPAQEQPPPPAPPAPAPAGGAAKSIKIKQGEVVTLSSTVNFFAMDIDDRDFFFKIVKQLEEYERGLGSAVPPGQGHANEGGEE